MGRGLQMVIRLAELFIPSITSSFPCFQFCPYYLYYGRKYGYEYNCYDQQLEVLLYERKISEKVSCIAEKQYPESAAYQVVDHEIVIVHFTHSGYKGSESTDNRYESGDDYGFASIFLQNSCVLSKWLFLNILELGLLNSLRPKK